MLENQKFWQVLTSFFLTCDKPIKEKEKFLFCTVFLYIKITKHMGKT